MDEDAEVTVKLTPDEIIERCETMAGKVLHIESLRTKKKNDSKNTQTLIDAELDEVARLARVITGQEELRKQGDLTFDETEAADALQKVGEQAGVEPDPEPGPEKVTPFPKAKNVQTSAKGKGKKKATKKTTKKGQRRPGISTAPSGGAA